MQTITFYSYKGGVGRTLALANVAKRLSEFKKKVCMLDFDLEAPGLHFKFGQQLKSFEFKKGIVDYIHEFVVTKDVPKTIKDCVETIYTGTKNPPIHFIPAGNVSDSSYWKKLSAINWNDLFYNEESEGIPFFLDLKEKIRQEFSPDFLLVDSRTGISEISGISMSLYADKIVVVAANNDENLIGDGYVIKSISNPENTFFEKSPEIIFALSRIPYPQNSDERRREFSIIENAKRKLNYKQDDEILIIHSDRELEIKESLKIGYEQDKRIPVAEDYLKLFYKITSGFLTKVEIDKFNKIKEAEVFAERAKKSSSQMEKIELFSKAIELNPENDEYFLARGIGYYNNKEFESALQNFENSIKLNEKNSRVYFWKGVIFKKQRLYEEAIGELEKAILLNPQGVLLLNEIGNIYREQEKFDKALECYNEALKISPNTASVYNSLADFYRKQKQYDLALKNIYKALELDSTEGVYHGTLAEINAQMGNVEEFYKNLEMAMIFDAPLKEFLSDEAYKPFLNEERFKKLLSKYNIEIPSPNN